jgi:glycerophosphoryl diester phosphodiesterase
VTRPARTGYRFLDDGGPVLAFAHRGGARHPDVVGMENTRLAFAHAVALGYTYLETDVHVTRDDVLVAFHDALLDRVTDGVGSIEELVSSDVARLRVGAHASVPTLAELVAAFPVARFNIDVKSEAAVAPLAGFVVGHRLEDRVLVGSFSGRRLRRFRRLTDHRVATSASPGEVAAYLLLPARLARRLAPDPVALQVPHRRGPLVVASARLVRRAHAAGVQVHVWTVDDADEMSRLLARGVDGLMTDRTDILREVLQARGLWRTADEERSGE